MFNIKAIIRNNNATFYDFATGQRHSQTLRAACTIVASTLFAVLCPKVSDNLLAGFLAVQSILLGFTFNVMFFLIGNAKQNLGKSNSIENSLRVGRLNSLHNELFHNVSYFNLVAVSSIIIATVLLLPSPSTPPFLKNIEWIPSLQKELGSFRAITAFGEVVHYGLMFLFYMLAIEGLHSIMRTISRTSFYFEQKLALQNDK